MTPVLVKWLVQVGQLGRRMDLATEAETDVG